MPRTHWLALAALCGLTGTAAAYDVATSSTGAPLHWAPGTVSFALALSPGPSEIDPAAAAGVAATSAATWQAALGSAGVTVQIAAAPVAAKPHAADGVPTVRWALTAGDPDLEMGLLGRTFVAYKAASGELVDADVVLNAADYTWTTTTAGCGNAYDLQSALTHELGHAVGLAHSIGHPEATMYATGDACETTKRDLAPDDVAGLAELYAAPSTGGAGGCAATGSSGGAALGLALGAVLATRRRRRLAAAAIAVTGLGLAAPASAAQLRHVEIAELADHAVLVVRGHVTGTVTHAPERATALETDATVVVDECLAGACPAAISVRRHGGELGDDGQWVDGEATLALGDEVVLFVRMDATQHARVLAGVQGMWQVAGGAAIRDLRAHELATESGWQVGEREVLSLPALRAAVRARRRL